MVYDADLDCKPLVLILVPGLGADHRLFDRQREAFPDLCTPRWLQPYRGEDLERYAARLASQIAVTGPLILGGCSFGGMIAYEMARILRPKALVLIGSTAAPSEIPVYLRGLSILASVIPPKAFILGGLICPAMARFFGVRTREQQVLFAEMLRSTSVEFLQWACTRVGRWRPRPLVGVPIFTIHGERDWILPLSGRTVDVIVQGAGHLLTITHAESVNEFLLQVKRRLVIAAREKP